MYCCGSLIHPIEYGLFPIKKKVLPHLFKINQIHLLGGTGEGCVQPAVIGCINAVVAQKPLVNEHAFPLAALGFVAGNGVGKLYLQCVVIGILFDKFYQLPFVSHFWVVFSYGLKQMIGQFISLVGTFSVQGIQQKLRIRLMVSISPLARKSMPS